jgi:hypothetical protein
MMSEAQRAVSSSVKLPISNMVLDGGPHLIDLAAEAKVFNF